MGWIKTKKQQGRVHLYHTRISSLYADGKLDENDICFLDELERGITDAYPKGKITDQQYKDLKNEISLLYEEIYDKKIVSFDGGMGEKNGNFLDTIKDDITDAYAKGKINESHYKVLNEKILKKAANHNTMKRDEK